MAEQAIQIGELSRRTGCNIETIRYYERIGLMPAPPRRGRYRSYGGEDVGRLGFVRRARELGFTLDEVRALLRRRPRTGHVRDVKLDLVLAEHLAENLWAFDLPTIVAKSKLLQALQRAERAHAEPGAVEAA